MGRNRKADGRAKTLGVGLLCDGYGQAELEGAGAYRVYKIWPTCCNIWASWESAKQDEPRALVPSKISSTHQVWGTIMAAPCGAAAALFHWYK